MSQLPWEIPRVTAPGRRAVDARAPRYMRVRCDLFRVSYDLWTRFVLTLALFHSEEPELSVRTAFVELQRVSRLDSS